MADLQDVLDDLKDLLKGLPALIAEGVAGTASLATAGVNAGVGLGAHAAQGLASGMEKVGDFYIGIGKGLGQGVAGLTRAANEIAGLIDDWDKAFRSAPGQVVGAALGGIGQALGPAVHGLGQVAGLAKDWAQAAAIVARPVLRKGRMYGNRAGRRTFRNAKRHGLNRGAGFGARVSQGVGFAGGIARGLGANGAAAGLMAAAGPIGMVAAVAAEAAGALKDFIPQVIAFAEGVNDANRRLAPFSGQIAGAMASLQFDRFRRSFDLAGQTGDSAAHLARAVDRMEDSLQALSVHGQLLKNEAASAGAGFVSGLFKNLDPILNAANRGLTGIDDGSGAEHLAEAIGSAITKPILDLQNTILRALGLPELDANAPKPQQDFGPWDNFISDAQNLGPVLAQRLVTP